jgi:hypothetical protein
MQARDSRSVMNREQKDFVAANHKIHTVFVKPPQPGAAHIGEANGVQQSSQALEKIQVVKNLKRCASIHAVNNTISAEPKRGGAQGIWRVCWWLMTATTLQGATAAAAGNAAGIISNQRDLQQTIDAAPSNSVVRCDPNRPLILSAPVTIRKPLTLVGLHARLPEKLGSTPLVVVEANGVAVMDFELTGNADSVPQSERAPLLVIHAGDFRVENGRFLNSSKDGVMIDGDGSTDEDLVGGVVRDIVGRGVVRDVVSISGSDGKGRRIRNVLVDNIRCYDSRLRGAVEVSDGTDNITVRKVYAESAVYAIDVQDHKRDNQSNRNVVVEDVYALRCKHALRTANTRRGHANLTVRDITAQQCVVPVQISHTDNVNLSNVRVLDHQSGKPPIYLQDCRGVSVRDVVVENASVPGAVLLLENCEGILVDGFGLRGQTNRVANAVCIRITTQETFSGARISNVAARGVTDAGIVLEAVGQQKGTLTDYLIMGNLASVLDRIQGERASISNNLP